MPVTLTASWARLGCGLGAVVDLFGDGAVGPIVVGAALAIGCYFLWRANRATNIEPDETVSENPTFGPAPTATRVPAAVS